jgi:NitT/TauT family transport system substrate-binding protein
VVTLAGTAGLFGVHPRSSAAEPPPETAKLRLFKIAGICIAPEYVAEEFLRGEGFTEVHYVEAVAGAGLAKALASGEAQPSLSFVAPVLLRLDAGDPIAMLAGVHVGWFELFGSERVQTIRDLKGKTVAVQELGSSQHVFPASMVAYVGLDPSKDVHWVTHPRDEAMQLFAAGKIDAYLGFPPDPQHLRGQKIGYVVVNSSMDRPWSHYFCCVATGNREFVRKHPVATKRALRAILKATDVCALEPARAAQAIVAKGFTPRYEYALQTMQEVPYDKWREYDPRLRCGSTPCVCTRPGWSNRVPRSSSPRARTGAFSMNWRRSWRDKGTGPVEQAGEHRVPAILRT